MTRNSGNSSGQRPKRTGWRKLLSVLREDTSGIHPRLIALNFVTGLLPRHRAGYSRARLFAVAGFRIGEGTRFAETPKINGDKQLYAKLIVGKDCQIGSDCVFDLSERITIGDRVTLGPGVMVLTSTHELDTREHRAGAPQLIPVTIGDGAWLGPRVVVLPGIAIGEGAIVEAGSVVNKEVPPHTRVGGTPAVPLKSSKDAKP